LTFFPSTPLFRSHHRTARSLTAALTHFPGVRAVRGESWSGGGGPPDQQPDTAPAAPAAPLHPPPPTTRHHQEATRADTAHAARGGTARACARAGRALPRAARSCADGRRRPAAPGAGGRDPGA